MCLPPREPLFTPRATHNQLGAQKKPNSTHELSDSENLNVYRAAV